MGVIGEGAASEGRPSAHRGSGGWFRWVICGLLFLATTINYIDRQVIGVLKVTLHEKFGSSEIDYSKIVFCFQLAYAAGYALGGRVMDLIGLRLGYLLAVLGWSLAAMGHGLARRMGDFCAARFGLGLAEGGNFPAAIKAVSEWFPRKERALAASAYLIALLVIHRLLPRLEPMELTGKQY